MDEQQLEDVSESEYLRGEARHAQAAIRRTVDDLRRAGGSFSHPGQTFRRHPWASTGVVVVIGALLGLTAYGLFSKPRRTRTSRLLHLRNGRLRRSRRRPGVLRSAFRAMTWLGGNLAMLKALVPRTEYGTAEDEDGAELRDR